MPAQDYGVTVTLADFAVAERVAEIVATVLAATEFVVTVASTVVAPSGTITLA